MFGKLMNNYYYGKSGKGDFRKEDLPENRWELFWDTLRTRLSALVRLNLMYMIVWLPTMIVLLMTFMDSMSNLNTIMAAQDGTLKAALVEEGGGRGKRRHLYGGADRPAGGGGHRRIISELLYRTLLILIPCIAITGPATAGVSYVTRNWARDEHAFIWSDFKDAVKENWKQGLVISLITSLMPLLAYMGWQFYGGMAATQPFMVIPQVLVIMVAIIWSLGVTYMYPLMVTYELKLKDVLRNGLLLGVARLPMSMGIRLLHCVPLLLAALLAYIWNPIYAALILVGYYVLIGFSLSRFVTASYTNAVFDRFLNSRIEGAKVNQGLRQDSDEDDGRKTGDRRENARIPE